MEGLLIDLEQKIFGVLDVFLKFINIFSGGISILTIAFVSIWALYRSYLILAGMEAGSFVPIFKDLFIKMILIVGVATAPAYYQDLVKNLLIDTTNDLAFELSGKKEGTIMSGVGEILDRAIDGLTIVSNPPEATEAGKEDENASWLSKGWTWLKKKVMGVYNVVEYTLGGWLDAFSTFMKLMIISAGALYLGVISFLTVFTSKVFAYMAVAAGPLFVFFAAFNITRNWFFSWLASAVGYLFTYVTVMMVWGAMFKIFDKLFYRHNTEVPITWFTVCESFVACYFFAKIISKAGDLTGQWFSAGNITDAANNIMREHSIQHGRQAIKGTRVVGETGAAAVKGAYKGGKAVRNMYKGKSSVKEG